jgi:hypothetical protein
MKPLVSVTVRHMLRRHLLGRYVHHNTKTATVGLVFLPLMVLLCTTSFGTRASNTLNTWARWPDLRRPERRLQGIRLTDKSIRDAVDLYLSNRIGAEATYGLIESWDTSEGAWSQNNNTLAWQGFYRRRSLVSCDWFSQPSGLTCFLSACFCSY